MRQDSIRRSGKRIVTLFAWLAAILCAASVTDPGGIDVSAAESVQRVHRSF